MLREKIQKEFIEALRSGDQLKRSVLSMLINSMKNRELAKRGQLSKSELDTAKLESQIQLCEEEELETISTEIKKRKEAIDQFLVGNRPELADKEKRELDILIAYMPEQMSENDIRKLIKEEISSLGVKDSKEIGKLLGSIMPRLKGRADGKMVSQIAMQELAK